MFVGFDVIPQSAEEIDIPFSEIGKLLMLSIGMAVAWYVAMVWAVSTGCLPTNGRLPPCPPPMPWRR
jgi:amino acid transporter